MSDIDIINNNAVYIARSFIEGRLLVGKLVCIMDKYFITLDTENRHYLIQIKPETARIIEVIDSGS